MGDNDTKNDNKSQKKSNHKRKQRDTNNNPLAVARQGGNHKKGSSHNNKAESLWHKRSGIGYRLFVEYYRHQPVGVVVAPTALAVANDESSTTNDKNNVNKDSRCNLDDQKNDHRTNSCESKPTSSSAAAAVASAAGGDAGGAGQSRAAKKRRKKKGVVAAAGHDDQQQPSPPHPAMASSASSTGILASAAARHTTTTTRIMIPDDQRNTSHPLLEALRQFQSSTISQRGGGPAGPSDSDHEHHDLRFQEFLRALSQPLPLSFRIRQGISSSQRQELTSYIQEHFSNLVTPMSWNDSIYQAVAKPLLATTASKTSSPSSSPSSKAPPSSSSSTAVLSKSNLAHVSPLLKEFLQKHSIDGTLARQEVGSMLPVLGLHRGGWLRISSTTATTNTRNADTGSSSSTTSSRSSCFRVLDMCASPGSKTLQVLEFLQQQQQQQHASKSSSSSTLRRISIKANDVNATRLETLRQAVERTHVLQTTKPSSSSLIKYTNFDASQYPIPPSLPNSNKDKAYNVILCDVPCSGDGTIRKDGHILPNWTPSTSHALHQLQVSILYRALCCLRPSSSSGGTGSDNGNDGSNSTCSIVSYSTCSLNPIENEAVVAAAILKARQTGLRLRGQGRQQHVDTDDGKHTTMEEMETAMNDISKKGSSPRSPRPIVELVDWPEMPRGFLRRPGVSTWNVADYVGHDVDEDEDDDYNDGPSKEKKKRPDDGRGRGLLRWHATYQDAVQAQMDHAVPTMWPPAPTFQQEQEDDDNDDDDEDSSLHLERCVRLLPQDHDTGGFFVALIRRNF